MKLNAEQIQKELSGLNNWELDDNAIASSFDFKDFNGAMAFVNKVADEAERMDHHPDIYISYNNVKLTLSTHSEGGLTEKDFALAKTIDQL